jgi:AbrB family transcriptional regulator (stage V sporulation protein T)
MKATGIVRRIDDLGRVVIPKEIRRTMRIREGDPLEIYTDREGEVIFKKYSPIGELNSFAQEYAETLYKTCNLEVIICDRDAVIAVAGVSKKEYLDKALSSGLEGVMQGRSIYKCPSEGRDEERLYPTADASDKYVSCAMPIISEGDVIGCVASLCSADKRRDMPASDVESKLIMTAANFLGKQMES